MNGLWFSSQEPVFAEGRPVLQVKLQALVGMGVGTHASILPALFNYEYSCSIFGKSPGRKRALKSEEPQYYSKAP